MRLLTETHDHVEMLRIKMLLESKGIPVFVANENTARNFLYGHPANKLSINILYEQQYEDAIALLNNEEHEVAEAVDVEEYKNITESASPDYTKRILEISLNVFFIVVFVIFVLYLIFK